MPQTGPKAYQEVSHQSPFISGPTFIPPQAQPDPTSPNSQPPHRCSAKTPAAPRPDRPTDASPHTAAQTRQSSCRTTQIPAQSHIPCSPAAPDKHSYKTSPPYPARPARIRSCSLHANKHRGSRDPVAPACWDAPEQGAPKSAYKPDRALPRTGESGSPCL